MLIVKILGAMDIAGTQDASLLVTKLVEAKERVIASAAKVSVIGRALLSTMQCLDQQLHRLTQVNLLSLSARNGHYWGNLS